MADDLVSDADRAGCDVAAIGVVVLGIVDDDEGIARWSAAVGWRDVPLQRLVADRVHAPVVVGHDVRAAALAEATLGAGSGHRNVLFVPLGTGLAAAQVIDGQVALGATWRAGEIGQLPVHDGSGRRIPLESVAAARGLARRYEQAMGLAPGTTDAAAVMAAEMRAADLRPER